MTIMVVYKDLQSILFLPATQQTPMPFLLPGTGAKPLPPKPELPTAGAVDESQISWSCTRPWCACRVCMSRDAESNVLWWVHPLSANLSMFSLCAPSNVHGYHPAIYDNHWQSMARTCLQPSIDRAALYRAHGNRGSRPGVCEAQRDHLWGCPGWFEFSPCSATLFTKSRPSMVTWGSSRNLNNPSQRTYMDMLYLLYFQTCFVLLHSQPFNKKKYHRPAQLAPSWCQSLSHLVPSCSTTDS